jgi:hypothetical protein
VYEKSGAPAVWMFEGILSCSTAPGIGVVVVASAGAGDGAAGAAVLRAGAAPPDTLAGALRGGGATGVVAMTWISGSFVALELEASWAATVPGAIASAVENAQSDLRSRARTRNLSNCRPSLAMEQEDLVLAANTCPVAVSNATAATVIDFPLNIALLLVHIIPINRRLRAQYRRGSPEDGFAARLHSITGLH